MNNWYVLRRASIVLLFLACAAAVSSAQNAARYDPADNSIEFIVGGVGFTQIKEVYLSDFKKDPPMARINLSRVRQLPGVLSLALTQSETPTNIKSEPVALSFIVEKSGKRLLIVVNVVAIGTGGSSGTTTAKAKNRDESELFVSGELIAAKGKKPEYSADVKYEREFALRTTPLRFAPFFDLKISNSPRAADALRTGLKFIAYPQKKLKWTGSAEVESDRKFRVTNFISSHEFKYIFEPVPYPKVGTPKSNLFFRPFIGSEFGVNLKSAVARDERTIARLKAGATLVYKIFEPFGDLGVKSLSWESKFEERWFLTKEQAYDTNSSGNLILRDFGRKPRAYFSSVLLFKLNDRFGPSISYEWGELPPLFKKVEHRTKLGFTYSFKRSAD